jgi:hypothetical protein
MGILIEHHAGNLPLWLAPQQVKVLTITSDANEYANEIVAELRAAGLRADCDLRNEKISYKVREHSVAKVPALFAVGQREIENRTVAVRRLGSPSKRPLRPSRPRSNPGAKTDRDPAAGPSFRPASRQRLRSICDCLSGRQPKRDAPCTSTVRRVTDSR